MSISVQLAKDLRNLLYVNDIPFNVAAKALGIVNSTFSNYLNGTSQMPDIVQKNILLVENKRRALPKHQKYETRIRRQIYMR